MSVIREIIRIELGAYMVYMPESVTWKKLIEIRKSIKRLALEDGIEKIAVIYQYPDGNDGVLDMDEYHEMGMQGIVQKVSQTLDIRYEYVVFVGIPRRTVGGLPNAMREFYKLIHAIFPSLGRRIAFADSVDDAITIVRDWKAQYE